MNRFISLKLLCFLLVAATISAAGLAETTSDFAGNWVVRLGNRALIVVTLKPATTRANGLDGWLARPTHFNFTGMGNFISDIKGPTVQYPIVGSIITGNCLAFTTQNPADKNDQDKFRLCLSSSGHATLTIDIPTFESWPVIKEKGAVIVATDWDSARTYYLDETKVSNAEMQRIFEADQKDRRAGFAGIDWSVVNKRDAARRETVRQLLAEGKLRSGKDFERAAFIFQHGGTPEDCLLAHTLAMVAVARGDGNAIWIAAATLDRYLQSINQPQIYGTQYKFKRGGQMTQDPYDRSLISDALRRDLGVPSEAEQKSQEKQYEKSRKNN
ncbi:MAG TPA: hypothetical protein VFQ24_18705 [Terriglobia bacterium]|nr:hypothetical protein [Terriglobia bacterium]